MNFDGFFGFGVFIVFLYFIAACLIQNNAREKNETLDYNDMENLFFENIKNGKIKYRLLSIYTPFDLMMIKSLLISENIPYYAEFEHLMGLRPFVHSLNYNNSNIYILEEDYDDAITVINHYIGNKKLNEYNIKGTVRGIIEMLCINWVVTTPQNYMGMEIHYKK